MKNTTYLILVLGVILAITIMTTIDQSDASPAPEPKRRKSGGSRKSSSGTSWWGGSNKQKNSGTSYSFIVGNKRMIEFPSAHSSLTFIMQLNFRIWKFRIWKLRIWQLRLWKQLQAQEKK